MDVFFTVILMVFGLLCLGLLRNHLHEAKLVRLREMVHKERMTALERDCPVPVDESGILQELLGRDLEQSPNSVEGRTARERLISLGALCLGLTTLLGGAGLTLGLHFQADPEISGLWGIGLIPTFIGIGLLMFVRLSRGMSHSTGPDQDPG